MPPIRNERMAKQQRHNPMALPADRKRGQHMDQKRPPSRIALPTDKKRGQHMLKNPGIVDKIVSGADIKPSDVIFEIGPGTGNLTMKLAEAGKRVVAYEVDSRMAAEVRKRLGEAGRTNVTIEECDAVRGKWPTFDVCAANLPYQISSPFVFRLLAHRPTFRVAVVMLQKEFAERLIAQVGDAQYGRLAVNTRLFVKVNCVCKVSRKNFNPPPQVDSMIVRIVPRNPPIQVDFREWDGLMRICFSRKNKTLRSSFCTTHVVKTVEENYRTWCALNGTQTTSEPIKDRIIDVLKTVELLEKRASKVDIDSYFRLLLEFNKRGIHFTNLTVGAKRGDKQTMPDADFFDDCGQEDMEQD